eukprot:3940715-Rhodomonas_salina.1
MAVSLYPALRYCMVIWHPCCTPLPLPTVLATVFFYVCLPGISAYGATVWCYGTKATCMPYSPTRISCMVLWYAATWCFCTELGCGGTNRRRIRKAAGFLLGYALPSLSIAPYPSSVQNISVAAYPSLVPHLAEHHTLAQYSTWRSSIWYCCRDVGVWWYKCVVLSSWYGGTRPEY